MAALAERLWDDARRESLTPSAIVAALDRHIVGQAAAKRAVAVALRNRWRRQRVEPAAFRDEIMPKNILMVGEGRGWLGSRVGTGQQAGRGARDTGRPRPEARGLGWG